MPTSHKYTAVLVNSLQPQSAPNNGNRPFPLSMERNYGDTELRWSAVLAEPEPDSGSASPCSFQQGKAAAARMAGPPS